MNRVRASGSILLAPLAPLAILGCAVATSDTDDAGEFGGGPGDDRGLTDLYTRAPDERPRFDGALISPPPPAPPTGAPSGAPTAAPTAAPSEPPTDADCVTDQDCSGDGMLCFGGFCVADPAAPRRVGEGACTNEADEAVLREIPTFRDISTNCNVGCLAQPAPCLQNCVAHATDLSGACGQCYGVWVACVSAMCLIQCGVVGEGTCTACRAAFCDPALGDCGGFAAPQQW